MGAETSSNSRDAVIQEYMPAIRRKAAALSRAAGLQGIEGDLSQAGAIGLLDAIEKYDSAREVKFSTFAWPKIRGAMLDELRGMDSFSRASRNKVSKVERYIAEFMQSHRDPPEYRQMVDEMKRRGISEEALATAIRMGHQRNLSMDSAGENQNGDTYNPYETIRDEKATDPVKEAVRREFVDKVFNDGLLDNRQKRILVLHFSQGMTEKEIGELMGVEESRVCQIQSEALRTLRAYAKGRGYNIEDFN